MLIRKYVLIIAALIGGLPMLGRASEAIDFNNDIRPILSANCFRCHGPDGGSRVTDLRLDSEDEAKADLGGYRAIDVEDPEASELLRRIEADDESELMPPPETHTQLSGAERALLRRWIEGGARWSDAWAYRKPQWTEPPAVSTSVWPENWIDHFILNRLEREGIAPSSDAGHVTLIRRLALDLTGLPPDQPLVDAFIDDPSDTQYEASIDALLASPRFGERMAMYWLDLVRYADTVGYHGDQEQTVWPYRDYVIHSFNENKPFDEFTRQQLAGDLLPNATIDHKIASIYNRLLQTSHEGGVQLKEYRAIYLADRVRNVSQVWMAATMGCCQCHDHKFDPLPSEEFYALGAFFADIDDEDHLRNQYHEKNNRNPTRREPALDVQGIYQRQRLARFDETVSDLGKLDKTQDAELVATLRKLRQELNRTVRVPVSKASEPREVRVLARGDWQDDSGTVVQPSAPAALGWQPMDRRATRLDLANWLTDTEQGIGLLTARVMVNRLWYLMFGEGLAEVMDDFGGQGQPPTHPRLLDNLAIEFTKSGWNVKHLLKLIAMSHTYRQSSVATDELRERDPANALVARQGRFRLPAEMVRDAALRASGLLVEKLGGPSVRPYQPAGYYRHLNFPTRTYRADGDQRQWRRGVYVHWQRQFLHPMLKAFDAPRREECTARRSRSNTPLAALTLLNDPTFLEAACAFAADVVADTNEPHERVDRIFRRALSRSADEIEQALMLELVETQQAWFADHPEATANLLQNGTGQLPEKAKQPELAAWVFACRAVLNLGETYTRQ